MYERLLNKNEMPTMKSFAEYMGKRKGLFENIDAFLIEDLKSEKKMKFDAHSSCWKMSYHRKRKYICDIYTENDSFQVVTRLSEESIGSVYDESIQYIKECIDNSPYRHRGWIGCRVLDASHLENVKTVLRVRSNQK